MTQWLIAPFPSALLLAASALLLFIAAAFDVAARRVPNPVAASLAAIGIVLHVPSHDLVAALGAGLSVLAVGFFCWRRGWMGGGDAKLLAAAAMLVAPSRVPGLILAVALAGGVLAGIYLLLRAMTGRHAQSDPKTNRHRGGRLARVLRIEQRRIARRAPLPYASAICAGAVFTLLAD